MMRRGGWAVLILGAAGAIPASSVGADPREAPRRVASLNLAADEVLVEILPRERLVAVTRFADDPENSNVAGRVPPQAERLRADIERLVALRPDLVIVSEYHDADFLDLLRRSRLRVHRLERLSTLDGIRRGILGLGEAVGEPAAARVLVARFDARLDEVARRLAGAGRPRVLYWSNPHTAGADTSYGALIECAGGRNVGRELGLRGIVPIGAERAFVADPDVVLLGFSGHAQSLREHPLLAQWRSVREGRVVEMPTPLLVALSHHAASACEWLAARLHPDRFRRP